MRTFLKICELSIGRKGTMVVTNTDSRLIIKKTHYQSKYKTAHLRKKPYF